MELPARLSFGLAILLVVRLSSAYLETPSYFVKLDFRSPLDNGDYSGVVQIKITNKEEHTDKLILYAAKETTIKKTEIKLQEIGFGSIGIKSLESQDDKLYLTLWDPLKPNFNYSLEIPFRVTIHNEGNSTSGVIVDGDIIYTKNELTEESHANGAFPCFGTLSTFTLELKHSKEWKSYSFTNGIRTEYKESTVSAVTKFNSSKAIYPNSLSFVVVRNYEEKTFTEDQVISFLLPKGHEPSVYLKRCANMSLYNFMDNSYSEDMDKIYLVSISKLTNDSHSNLNMIYMKSSLIEDDPEATTDDNAELCLMTLKLIAQQFYGIRLPPKTLDEKSGRRDNFISQAAPYFLAVYAFNEMDYFWGSDFIKQKTTELFDMAFKDVKILEDETGLKGAAFLGMLPDYVGKDINEIAKVMASFYENAVKNIEKPVSNEDFYKFLTENDVWNISSVLSQAVWDQWMTEPEILLLTVQEDGDSYKIDCPTSMAVPVYYNQENKTKIEILCNGGTDKIGNTTLNWILLNYNGKGLYRVKYSDKILGELKDLDKSYLSLEGKSRMISDVLEMAIRPDMNIDCPHAVPVAGQEVTFEKALELTNYLVNEYECTPWKIAIKKFYILRNLFFSNPNKAEGFTKRMRQILAYYSLYLRMEESNSFVSNMCRKTILEANVMFNVGETVMNLFETYFLVHMNYKTPESVGGDILQAAKCAALAKYGKDYWQIFDEEYNPNSDQIKKRRLFEQYSCSNIPDRVLKKVMKMDSDDKKLAFDYLTSKPENVGPVVRSMSNKSSEEVPPEVMKMMLLVIGPRLNGRLANTTGFLATIKDNYAGDKEVEEEVDHAEYFCGNISNFNDNCGPYMVNWLKTNPDTPITPPTTPTGPPPPTEPNPSSETPTGMTSSNTAASTDGDGTTANPSSTTTDGGNSATSAALSTAAALVAAAAILTRL